MGYLTLGTWTIPYAWIAFLLAYFYVDIRNRKAESQWPNAFEHLLWVYLISWKASYILFYWNSFLSAPMSILYFDGGWKGHLLALVVMFAVFVVKKMVEGTQSLVVIWLQFFAVFSVVITLLNGHYALAALAMLALIFIEKKVDAWAFAVLFMVLTVQGDWLHPFLWISLLALVFMIVAFKEKKYVAPVVVASMLGILMGNVVEQSSGAAKEVEPLALQSVGGETYSVVEDEHSIIVLNFFATWCPPCKAEMPHLQAFAEKLPQDVSIIGVNLTARDHGEQALQNFMEMYEVTYPIVLDEDDTYGDAYGVLSMPTTVILKDGKEVERIVGPVSEETLQKMIRQLK